MATTGQDSRVGYAFNNPNLNGDELVPGWGEFVTPDDLRGLVGFGTTLAGPEKNETYDDNRLRWYIRAAMSLIAAELGIIFYPMTVLYDNSVDESTGEEVERIFSETVDGVEKFYVMTGLENNVKTEVNPDLVIRERGYSFRRNPSRHYLFQRLMKRPLRRILSVVVFDPVNTVATYELYNWRNEHKGFESSVSFSPQSLGSGSFALFAGLSGGTGTLGRFSYPFQDRPGSLLIDYEVGFKRASEVPEDFRPVILWLSGMFLLLDLGDAKSGALASQSISLNSISQSASFPLSATSGFYQSRYESYAKSLKRWIDTTSKKYRFNFMGVL